VKPRVTIITIVKDSKHSIERTIQSLIEQEFNDFQYIVIDGKSSDGTVDIIKKYSTLVDVFISEFDNGTSDAFNKALDFIKGDYVIWLAADDCFGSKFLSHAVTELEKSNADLFWGSMTMYSAIGQCSGRINQNHDIESCLKNGRGLNFPSMMIKTKYLKLIGGLDLSVQYCNDIEWLLRAYSIQKPKHIFSNKVSIHRDDDGKVSKNFRAAALEMIKVYRQYSYSILPLLKNLIIREVINIKTILNGKKIKW